FERVAIADVDAGEGGPAGVAVPDLRRLLLVAVGLVLGLLAGALLARRLLPVLLAGVATAGRVPVPVLAAVFALAVILPAPVLLASLCSCARSGWRRRRARPGLALEPVIVLLLVVVAPPPAAGILLVVVLLRVLPAVQGDASPS